MTELDHLSRSARRLWRAVEPLASQVYFAPECHSAYEELGFDGSRGSADGIQFPDRIAYFVSRGACMGQVPGDLIAAAFGVFKREVVIESVDNGWAIAGRDDILDARQRGASAALVRMIGPEPEGLGRAAHLLKRAADAAPHEGRHLFSGLRSLGFPGDPMGDFWRAADLVREHRGDSHIAAWVAHDFDACEIGVVTDPWSGGPLRSWVRSRGWNEDELDAACDRLRSRGFLDGDELTDAGRQAREDVEVATDLGERRVIQALGDDIDELFALLEPWRDQVVDANGYPGAATKARTRR